MVIMHQFFWVTPSGPLNVGMACANFPPDAVINSAAQSIPMIQQRHNICEQCWRKLHPAMGPVRHRPSTHVCCFCGRENTDGIYIHHDGDLLPCKGHCHVRAGSMVCPRCLGFFFTPPILSRHDNHTRICLDCGWLEGLEASAVKAPYQGPQYWTDDSRLDAYVA